MRSSTARARPPRRSAHAGFSHSRPASTAASSTASGRRKRDEAHPAHATRKELEGPPADVPAARRYRATSPPHAKHARTFPSDSPRGSAGPPFPPPFSGGNASRSFVSSPFAPPETNSRTAATSVCFLRSSSRNAASAGAVAFLLATSTGIAPAATRETSASISARLCGSHMSSRPAREYPATNPSPRSVGRSRLSPTFTAYPRSPTTFSMCAACVASVPIWWFSIF